MVVAILKNNFLEVKQVIQILISEIEVLFFLFKAKYIGQREKTKMKKKRENKENVHTKRKNINGQNRNII